ncbi:MAG: hypothetical protein CV087_17870 [Candidatus Brocadia sp. WS118]|nr:MAG: hypothetical protein CV087_17870 [Candidatus Brocadia sp. WS118]
MKKFTIIHVILLLSLSAAIQSSAHGYGYAKEEDPLIKIFKAVIFYGRQTNWEKVSREIATISDRIADVHAIFKIDLRPEIDHAIQKQDFQSLTKHMANLIFFAIREKFYYNLQENLTIFTRSKVRLGLAEEYYLTLLAGNVRNYDVRHKTRLHEDIYHRFVKARGTLGSIGFFGAGAMQPDVKEFEILTKEIEKLLFRAFPYFITGKDTHNNQ